MEAKIRVLVVEDEPIIAENIKLSLQDLGYEVLDVCYDFAEAQSAIQANQPDLIILDINLGNGSHEKSGLELASQANELGLPFIFLTAYSDKDTILTATSLRPYGYLTKPVNIANLFATIQIALENITDREYSYHAQTPAPITHFFVKIGTKTHKVLWSEVLYMEAVKNYVNIYIKDSSIEYPIRGTLTFVLEQLVPDNMKDIFLRVNRSECVNIHWISIIGSDYVECDEKRFENTRYSNKEIMAIIDSRSAN